MATLHVTDRAGKEHTLTADTDTSVMEALRDHDMPIMAACGGCCACATCHVYVDGEWAGKVKPPEADEIELVSTSEYYKEGASRLSCQIQFTPELDGLRVTLAPED
jgi:2Fe-2S ferredoxin